MNGLEWVNIQHALSFFATSPISAADLTALLNAVYSGVALTTDWSPLTNSDCALLEVSVRDVGVAGSISIVRSLTQLGTATGDISNSATSALARMNVGYVPTFKKPGRLNWPGVLDTAVVANVLTSGAQGAYGTLTADFLADINGAASSGGNWTAVVRSLYFGSGGGTPGHPIPHPRETGITAPIISSSVRPKISGLNRRLRGGKRRR